MINATLKRDCTFGKIERFCYEQKDSVMSLSSLSLSPSLSHHFYVGSGDETQVTISTVFP